MLYFLGCTETIFWRKHKEDLNVSNQFIVAMYLNLRFILQRVSHANLDLGLVGLLDLRWKLKIIYVIFILSMSTLSRNLKFEVKKARVTNIQTTCNAIPSFFQDSLQKFKFGFCAKVC